MRKSPLNFLVRLAAILLAVVVLEPDAHAQNRLHAVTFTGGVFQFDLAGTGTAPLVGMSTDWSLADRWLLETGLTVAFPRQQFGQRTKFFIPEAQLHYEWLVGQVAPFIGGGVGAAIDVRNELENRTRLTLSAGGGVRFNLSDYIGLRTDFRLRGVEADFAGSAAEYRFGVYWRLN